MTREQNFRSTFVTAFATYSGWSEHVETPKKKLSLSSFTSFSVELGKTRFYSYDLTGRALEGSQDFKLTIYFSKPQNDINEIRTDRSDDIQTVQTFINDRFYPIPMPLPGETYRIESVELTSIEPMRVIPGESRYSIVVNGSYAFTML